MRVDTMMEKTHATAWIGAEEKCCSQCSCRGVSRCEATAAAAISNSRMKYPSGTNTALIMTARNSRLILPSKRQVSWVREISSWILAGACRKERIRSEEHTSDSSHQIISYAVFCLKKKKKT